MSDCWYIFEDQRAEDWVPFPRIAKKVEKALEDEELKRKIEAIRKKSRESA